MGGTNFVKYFRTNYCEDFSPQFAEIKNSENCWQPLNPDDALIAYADTFQHAAWCGESMFSGLFNTQMSPLN